MSDAKALSRHLSDQGWRLNNLYTITTKEGRKQPFRMNWAQQELWESLDLNNLVLKVRQIGISTFVHILFLDTCLFVPNTAAGVIAHSRESAEELFHRNIRSPYDDLPDAIRDVVGADRSSTRQLRFTNGSHISVHTSLRSGTYQLLHVSEFGKVCAKYPDRAREIVTGAFEAVPVGRGMKIVESTAEGREGYFHDYCRDAQALRDAGRKPSEHEFKFFFFPWWRHPEYRTTDTSIVVTDRRADYFREIEGEIGEQLPLSRRLWYVAKAATLGDDMMREYPSTPDEAFHVSVVGSYYGREIQQARREGRITTVPHQPGTLVHTWWDLGMDDEMAIWFVQRIGRQVHVIDYYHNSGEGLRHYAEVLQGKGYLYGAHIGPHDLRVRELGAGDGEGISRLETARRLGIRFTVAPGPSQVSREDGIQAVRNLLPICWFDEQRCDDGIKALEAYRKEWDERLGTYKSTPLHDWASNGADAFRIGAVGDQSARRRISGEIKPAPVPPAGWAA